MPGFSPSLKKPWGNWRALQSARTERGNQGAFHSSIAQAGDAAALVEGQKGAFRDVVPAQLVSGSVRVYQIR